MYICLNRFLYAYAAFQKAESNRKLREEIALVKKRQEVADRLKQAKTQLCSDSWTINLT